MTKTEKNGWCRLPVTEKKLQEAVDGYFEKCRTEETPPTPSGLALALGVRTNDLSDGRLSLQQQAVIARAMQRIEANTMEMMLTRGGVKGMESVLERVVESDGPETEKVRRLSDEEIRGRLTRLLPRIEQALEQK
jgi:hypothetical protein